MSERPISTLISTDPGVNGGKPRCAAGGVSVRQIAVMHNDGSTVATILESYPHLAPEEVYAALAYYYANRADIDADLEAEARAFQILSRGALTTA
jgi:uncharacterized protein (DUF433 family)